MFFTAIKQNKDDNIHKNKQRNASKSLEWIILQEIQSNKNTNSNRKLHNTKRVMEKQAKENLDYVKKDYFFKIKYLYI